LSLLTVMVNNESDVEVELYKKIVGDLSYNFPPQNEVSSQLTNVPSPSVGTIFQGPISNEDREMRELFAHGLPPALRHSSELAEVSQVPQKPVVATSAPPQSWIDLQTMTER